MKRNSKAFYYTTNRLRANERRVRKMHLADEFLNYTVSEFVHI